MRTHAIAFFLGAFLFCMRLDAEQTLAAQPMSSEIESLWQAGKTSQAERELGRWMKQEKKSPWPWVQSASLKYRQKKYKRALSDANAALEKDPNCAEAFYWRGKSYEEQKKPLEAANEYRAALMAQEQFVDAQEALNRVLALLDPS